MADMATRAWYGQLILGRLYNAAELLDVQSYTHVVRWAEAIDVCPAVKRGRIANRPFGDKSMQLHKRHDAEDFHTKDPGHSGSRYGRRLTNPRALVSKGARL